MPPPPPPSRSYLLKFDSSSSNEEDDSYDDDADDACASVTATTVSSSSLQSSSSAFLQSSPSHRRLLWSPSSSLSATTSSIPPADDKEGDEVISDKNRQYSSLEEQDYVKEETAVKRNRRIKKKKKKRTKKTSLNFATLTNCKDDYNASRRHVSFDSVHVRAMDRCLGSDSVPAAGSWPLGISDIVVDECSQALSDFENQKQVRLRQRFYEISLEHEPDSSKSSSTVNATTYLETRQWDHLSSHYRNKLFRPLQEKERMNLLLAYSSDLALSMEGSKHANSSQASSRNSPQTKTRARSGSFSGDTAKKKRSQTRQRSGSFGGISEQFNDTFSQLTVHAIRNELEHIRSSRSQQESIGCSCRKLHVYLMPSNGAGGKTAQHKRMNLNDLKKELRKRHLLPTEQTTREELELILHDAVEKEPCCSGYCSCVRNGINCQMEACGCWLPKSNQGSQMDETLSTEQIQQACGNQFGMYVVDIDRIQACRKDVLGAMTTCQFVQQQ